MPSQSGRESAADAGGGRFNEVRQSAARLFALRGYHGTNMADIARELGLRAPGLYNHITSKQALLEDICVTAMNQALSLQRAATREGSEVARLRKAAEAHVRFVVNNAAEALVADREFIQLEPGPREEVLRLRQAYESVFRSLIEWGNASGAFDVREPKLASYAIIEMGSSVAQWFRETGDWSLDVVAKEHGEYALRLVGWRPPESA
ncbi:MAG TPA: TetR/AcrR family transcriptional regulator [Streptosporangiaceae bacterium]